MPSAARSAAMAAWRRPPTVCSTGVSNDPHTRRQCMNDDQDLLLERRGDGIAVLTLNRPARLNALRRETVQRLRAELDALATDSGVRVLVLTGAGRGFCAGLDLGAPLEACE